MPFFDLDRREFLQATLAAGAASSLVSSSGLYAKPRRGARSGAGVGTQQSRHAGRRLQSDRERLCLELLRPADDLCAQDAARWDGVLRPQGTGARTGRKLADRIRRDVVHIQSAQGRDFPRRHAGYRQGRQMVVRSVGVGRWFSDLPDVGRQPREARAVRRGRRSHLPRRLHPQGQDADVQPRGGRALCHQFRACQEERHRRPIRGR